MTELVQGYVRSGVNRPLRVVSIIVPVFNEKESIKQLIDQIFAVDIPFAKKQTIIVDDGSTDGTQEWLQQRFSASSATGMDVKLVCQPRNLGKGSAIRTALQFAEGWVTVILDADLELDPADIPRLVNPILAGDADVVFGNRFVHGWGQARDILHYVTNKSLTFLAKLLTRIELNDVEVGFKAFRTDLLRRMALHSKRFEIEMELTAKVARLGCRVGEVPVSYTKRANPYKKKFRWWLDGIRAVYWLVYFRRFD